MNSFGYFRNYATKLASFIACIVQWGCITHCVLEHVGDFAFLTGYSMEPTLSSHNLLLAESISPQLHRIKRGDIVIARSPLNPRRNICKRVTGLPGDKVQAGLFSDVVPRGHVWLEGDNEADSLDSKSYGAVPQGLIRGRAICRVWPLSDIKMLTVSKKNKWQDKCR